MIPCYNAERYVGDAIRSCIAQSLRPHEVIAVDDGSSDRTADAARSAGADRVLQAPGNGGPSRTRNLGWRQATGDAIAFLDADDLWHANHLRSLATLLDQYAAAGVAYSNCRRFGAEDRPAEHMVPPGKPLDFRLRLIERNHVCQSGVLVRRSLLESSGGYDESMRYSEDYELWLRLSRLTQFIAAPDVTVSYRVHPSQASANQTPLYENSWRARLRHVDAIRDAVPAADASRLDELLLQAWKYELKAAWHDRSRTAFPAVLRLGAKLKGASEAGRPWRRRARFRPIWLVAARIYDVTRGAFGGQAGRQLGPLVPRGPRPSRQEERS